MPRFYVDQDIAKAKTLSKEFYTDPILFELSKDQLFAHSWQFAGDTDQLKNSGDVYPVSLLENYLDESLLLTKDKQGKMHCLSNVCTHRGNLLITEPCRLTNIRCKYHGRAFHLNGQFLSMPEFKEVKNFPTADDNLPQLSLFQWGKWLFTSLSGQYPASHFLQEMIDRMNWLPVEDFVFRPDLSRDYQVKAHWSLYCENYLEGFHIPFIHADLNAVIDYGNYTTQLFRYANLQLGIARDTEDCFDLPSTSPDYGKRVAAYYFWVFPNLMFNFYPWGLSINIVKPVAIAQTKVTFLTYLWDESKYRTGAGGDLNKVELEDQEVVQNVQRGIRSRFYQHGRYSVSREQGTHHFHRLLSEFFH